MFPPTVRCENLLHFCSLLLHYCSLHDKSTFSHCLCDHLLTFTHFLHVHLYHLCFGHFLHTKTHLFSLMFTFGSLLGEVTYAHFSTLMHVSRHRRRARRWPWAVWRRSWAFWRPKLHFQGLKIKIAFLFLLCEGYLRPLCASFSCWKWSCEAGITNWNRSA